ncbi:hypothetical protein O1L55_40815 [Streptomyces albulus]|nr:hypothetical protein [Streptomyces noursei]
MVDAIAVKSDVLFGLREVLRADGFREVVTPVCRRADLGPGRRAPVDLDGDGYLRAMIGPALRVNLEHHPRIFEIGPCFRPESPDSLHASEFSMLDLYAAGENFAFLFSLAERLVKPYIPYELERVSVAEHIREVFGCDLRTEAIGDLPQRMAHRLGLETTAPFKTTLGQFIEQELETRSKGRAMFLTDYPLGGDEPCARLTPQTASLINRFELIIDGLEVVHGYEDEVDGGAFTARAKAVDLYDDEQALAWQAIRAGRVPANSVGLGIGIERLCMAATGVKDITVFQQSPQF